MYSIGKNSNRGLRDIRDYSTYYINSEINLLKPHIGQAGIKYSLWPIHITMNYNSLIKYLELTPNVNGTFRILL